MNDQSPRPGPVPGPMPGPAATAGPDLDEMRVAFDDLLADSAGGSVASDRSPETVSDAQVEALDAAHELLAEALNALDAGR